MKLTNINQIDDFIDAIGRCRGDVWLVSLDGSRFNLKSSISRYIALGALLDNEVEDLELYCGLKEDECHFLRFFTKHEDAL